MMEGRESFDIWGKLAVHLLRNLKKQNDYVVTKCQFEFEQLRAFYSSI